MLVSIRTLSRAAHLTTYKNDKKLSNPGKTDKNAHNPLSIIFRAEAKKFTNQSEKYKERNMTVVLTTSKYNLGLPKKKTFIRFSEYPTC